MDRHFAWQAWHLWHWAASGGALGPHLAPWSPRLFAWQALGDIDLHWCGCLRGRRGTWQHRPSLCVAGVVLGDINVHSAWQVWHLWHLWHWAPSLGSRLVVVAAAVCVAGVAIGDIDLHFAWQAWHLATWIVTLRGRLWHLSIDHFNMPGLLHRINFGVYLLSPLLRHGICYPVLLLLPISDIDAMSDNHWFTMFI